MVDFTDPFEASCATCFLTIVLGILISLVVGPRARQLCTLTAGLAAVAVVILPTIAFDTMPCSLGPFLIGLPYILLFLAALATYHHRINGNPVFPRLHR